MKTIFCVKLNKEAPALDFQPYPGELGKKIFDTISKEAWQLWINQQTMLINEYRLNMLDAKSREFLAAEMEKFLFGEGSEKPSGFVEQHSN
jgi:Fe-S cluster biosynthesis and repair protein YggX